VITATSPVDWYNGHPHAVKPPGLRTARSVVIVGAGNVALEECPVSGIHVLARRSPENAKFTPKELGEIGQLHGADVVVHLPERSIGSTEAVSAAVSTNLGILRQWTKRVPEGGARRRIQVTIPADLVVLAIGNRGSNPGSPV
jgi:ferredoxin/flavodoxin---NADP+ reductase